MHGVKTEAMTTEHLIEMLEICCGFDVQLAVNKINSQPATNRLAV